MIRERGRRVLPIVAIVMGSAAVVSWWATGAAAAPTSEATAPAPTRDDPAALRARGERLYATSCSSCHGLDGRGVTGPGGDTRGPSLEFAGEAGAYYQLSTGRMPLADANDQALRKPRAFGSRDIAALVAYVASLGDGPELPRIHVQDGDLATGGELFRANCAPCHSASGSGGALSYGESAPHLSESSPWQVAAAVRHGPGQMPVFGADVLNREQVTDVAAYVQYLRDPDDRGGLPIGRTGPVPEGFVSLTLGIGALLAFVAWIGTFAPARKEGRT